mgnify:CR=1 FL=1
MTVPKRLAALALFASGALAAAPALAADTVKVRFQNETTGSVNLDAGNLYITVIPRGAYANRANLGE